MDEKKKNRLSGLYGQLYLLEYLSRLLDIFLTRFFFDGSAQNV
jgi:hypothetical protein